MLPSSFFVSALAIPVDVPVITAIALWKSPYMLIRGWKRLFEDLIGREGPFLETVCVPFAGLAILLWPLAVVAAVIASLLSSFLLALYGGVVVHQVHCFFPTFIQFSSFYLNFQSEFRRTRSKWGSRILWQSFQCSTSIRMTYFI